MGESDAKTSDLVAVINAMKQHIVQLEQRASGRHTCTSALLSTAIRAEVESDLDSPLYSVGGIVIAPS